jgi:hypothetical protein
MCAFFRSTTIRAKRLEIDNRIFQESSHVIPALIIKALQHVPSS